MKPRRLRGKQGYAILDDAAFHDGLGDLVAGVMACARTEPPPRFFLVDQETARDVENLNVAYRRGDSQAMGELGIKARARIAARLYGQDSK